MSDAVLDFSSDLDIFDEKGSLGLGNGGILMIFLRHLFYCFSCKFIAYNVEGWSSTMVVSLISNFGVVGLIPISGPHILAWKLYFVYVLG